MPIPIAAAAIPAVISAAGGIMGANQANRAGKDAERVLDETARQWAAINLPDLPPVEFERAVQEFKAQQVGDTALAGIEADPALREAQMAALGELSNIAESGGMTLADQAALSQIQGQLAQQDAGRQAAIMQNMAERGMGGSGMEMAQRMMSQQGAANRANQMGMQTAANAQERALQAIMQGGQLAGSLRAQDYGEQAEAARAQDMINQFNASQRQQEQQVRQGVADRNTDLTNQQIMYNQNQRQQQFDNALARQQGIAGTANTRAGVTSGRGQQQAQAMGSAASGIGQMAGAYFGRQGGS